jgi:hypothetical protein
VLYVPSEVPNKVVAEFLGNHGKVETITREMTTETTSEAAGSSLSENFPNATRTQS